MKMIGLLIMSIGFTSLLVAQKPGAVIDVQQYTFAITVSDSSNLIKGNAAIDILCIQNSRHISLDLVSNNNTGKVMKVLQVTMNGQSLPYSHSNNLLTIDLPNELKTGERTTIVVNYEGIPADGLIITNNKYGHRGFFSDNWPNRARNWLPCVDHPADKAAVDFIVTAPSHYQVISNGIQTAAIDIDKNKRRTHYKETVPLATKILALGIAEFAIQQAGDVQGIPVYSWVYPEDKDKGFYDYAVAVDILPFFIKNVAPFAYKKLANVQSTTMFGGMENAGAIFYAEDNSITGTRKSESLIAHEIAHQWFGNMATEADWSHLWLSEGFATYMAILYFEHKYGADTARSMLTKNRDQVIAFARKKLRPVVDSSVTNYMDLLNANSYQKGGWILHMLRRRLGDSTFWKGIRTYYNRFGSKNAQTSDLQAAMEEASGKDLKQFFHQWLFVAGHPMLDIQWKYNTAKKEVVVTVVQQQSFVFQFPLELKVGENLRTIEVKDKKTVVTFPVSEKPGAVIVDPEVNLLFEGKVEEGK
jgi:aminopeptidase N